MYILRQCAYFAVVLLSEITVSPITLSLFVIISSLSLMPAVAKAKAGSNQAGAAAIYTVGISQYNPIQFRMM